MSAKLCPICAKPATAESAPFCSRRCADVDLHRWLSEGYAIPVVEDEDEDGDSPASNPTSVAGGGGSSGLH